MTSKEALGKLIYTIDHCQYIDKEERKQAEKAYIIVVNDLLILEHLKANTFINAQYTKLKEWLEND